MAFFPEPIKPSVERKDEEIKVSPIESDKKYREKGREEENAEAVKNTSILYGSLLIIVKKFTSFFGKNDSENIDQYSQDYLVKSLKSLQELLQSLKKIDQSENSQFYQQLSEIWHELVDQVEIFARTRIATHVDINKVKTLITDISYYPLNEDHKLGYYLTQYAGESWLPIPLIQIIKNLRKDYLSHKKASVLEKWMELLREIIQ